MSKTSIILYRGSVSAGKWSDAEERTLIDATRSFLDGDIKDCAEGEAFTTYIAAYMNCSVSRILNKCLDKPILKARYLVSSEDFVERWSGYEIENIKSPDEKSLARDFYSLLQMEQERYLKYSANSALISDAYEALIERDREFNRRVQKMLELPATRRKRKSRDAYCETLELNVLKTSKFKE